VRAPPPSPPSLPSLSGRARPPRGTPHPPSFAHPVIRFPLPPSPSRVADLATKGYFDDPAFLGYLDHLAYWTRPEYAKFVHYPHALYFLDQLKRPAFRRAMANPRAVEHVFQQQYFHWQRHRTAQAEAATANAPPEGPGGGGDDAR
jgi:mediator of RNA polymerase II transcription subunit 31